MSEATMTRLASRCLLPLLLGAAGTLAVVPARGDASTAQARSAARTLAQKGDALWDQGKYEQALDKFNRAFDLVNVPTLALRQAECLEKLGRLVEASEKYLWISRTKLDENSPSAFRKAVEQGRDRGPKLRARLPMVTVVIQGQGLEGAKLTLDGVDVPQALWGTQWPVDPGSHVLELSKGERVSKEEFAVEEKGTAKIELTLPPGADEPPVAAAPAPVSAPTSPAASAPTQAPPPPAASSPPAPSAPQPVAGPQPATQPEADQTEPSGSSQAVWGWVGIGVGAAGVVTGTVTAIMLTSQRSQLDESCVDARCPPAEQDAVDTYNQLRPISTIGFAVGAVGLGAGLFLLLTAPDSNANAERQVQPWVGLGTAGLRGAF